MQRSAIHVGGSISRVQRSETTRRDEVVDEWHNQIVNGTWSAEIDIGVPHIRITGNHHGKSNSGTNVPGSNNQFLSECNANALTNTRMRGVEWADAQMSQIYATSSTLSREFLELFDEETPSQTKNAASRPRDPEGPSFE